MSSCAAFRYDRWPGLFLQARYFYAFPKAHNDGFPGLSKDIYTKHCNGYSLRDKDWLLYPDLTIDIERTPSCVEVLSCGTLNFKEECFTDKR